MRISKRLIICLNDLEYSFWGLRIKKNNKWIRHHPDTYVLGFFVFSVLYVDYGHIIEKIFNKIGIKINDR